MGVMRASRFVAAFAMLAVAGCSSASAPAAAAPKATAVPTVASAGAQPTSASPASQQKTPAPRTAAQGQPSATGGGSVPVRLGTSQNVTGNAPWWLGQQAGVLKQGGLDLQVENINATAAIKQLVAGKIDGIIAGAPESISARAEGSAIQIVATFQAACDMQMVVPKDVTDVSQLKGKTVAVITKASVNGVCTVADLRNHGLQAGTDYTLIETGSNGTYAAMVAALQGHHVDAGAMQPSFATKAAQGGDFHILYDLATEPTLQIAASSLTMSSAFIKAHPSEVQKTLDALLRAESYFKQNKPQAEQVLKTTFKITNPAQLDATYNRQVQLMATNVVPREELFPDLVKALGQVQPAIQKLDLSSLLAPQFAESAQQRGLTKF